MKILAKSWMLCLLVMVAASAALFAQTSEPEKPPIQASVLDARDAFLSPGKRVHREVVGRLDESTFRVIRHL